ncbi:probable leucine-rich repeat receptor-like protein kinase IMK3 [Mercurialis annua]|uniref:probable leucine-rich repeat receptor-like protein kinase IMK3 n=1 Tax=Mercurialis annua TaxID=3986 RepID=UPI00215F248B|nr:probable leucine-rich repeat receptor-like protein kinase IMK3 [Mercurialis annua]
MKNTIRMWFRGRLILLLTLASKSTWGPSPRSTSLHRYLRHTGIIDSQTFSDPSVIMVGALGVTFFIKSLSFTNCPITPILFLSDLALNLVSFSCTRSLKSLTGVWLSRFDNLTDLTIKSVTISYANVTGYIPKHLNTTLTHVDFSGNKLKGRLPSSISVLENLESLNLSSNALTGEIPTTLGIGSEFYTCILNGSDMKITSQITKATKLHHRINSPP